MEQITRIKVVMICHFTNSWLRANIGLQDERVNYADFGLWNLNIINAFKDREDIELHVILPHKEMRQSSQEFESNGVHYYVFRSELPYPWRFIDWHFQSIFSFPRNRRFVNHVIQRVKPDLINLIGAEKTYYSSNVLDIDNVPIIRHC